MNWRRCRCSVLCKYDFAVHHTFLGYISNRRNRNMIKNWNNHVSFRSNFGNKIKKKSKSCHFFSSDEWLAVDLLFPLKNLVHATEVWHSKEQKVWYKSKKYKGIMPHLTRNYNRKYDKRYSLYSSEYPVFFFMSHGTKRTTISYVHTTSSLMKFKKSKYYKKAKTMRESLHTQSSETLVCVFIMLVYSCWTISKYENFYGHSLWVKRIEWDVEKKQWDCPLDTREDLSLFRLHVTESGDKDRLQLEQWNICIEKGENLWDQLVS